MNPDRNCRNSNPLAILGLKPVSDAIKLTLKKSFKAAQRKLKAQILVFAIITALILIISCQNTDNKIEPIPSIVGQWIYEYELLSDGSKVFDNPYALLEFEYSDGFILREDSTGHSIWYNNINGDFKWSSDNSILTISVTRSNDTFDKFEYRISNLDASSMEFESPKGHKYFMGKQ